MQKSERFAAFEGMVRLCEGSMADVANAVSLRREVCPTASILVFNTASGLQTDIDLRDIAARGSAADDAGNAVPQAVGPGRPKLGVVGREVTLLPRHWDWLSSQPGGASVALRKLVETAMRQNVEKDSIRQRHEAAYKFMSAIAGNLAGYEEALRSLFANDQETLSGHIQDWPSDVRHFAMELAFPTQEHPRS